MPEENERDAVPARAAPPERNDPFDVVTARNIRRLWQLLASEEAQEGDEHVGFALGETARKNPCAEITQGLKIAKRQLIKRKYSAAWKRTIDIFARQAQPKMYGCFCGVRDFLRAITPRLY
jgi:hypothetical protein